MDIFAFEAHAPGSISNGWDLKNFSIFHTSSSISPSCLVSIIEDYIIEWHSSQVRRSWVGRGLEKTVMVAVGWVLCTSNAKPFLITGMDKGVTSTLISPITESESDEACRGT